MNKKPLTVAHRDTKLAVAQTLMQSGLPIDLVVSILRDLLTEAEQQSEIAYQNDLAQWKKKGADDGDTDTKGD